MRRIVTSLVLIAVAASVSAACAAAPQGFVVGGESFAQGDIVDARGLPQIDGQPVMMVTFIDAAVVRLRAVSAKAPAQPIVVQIDGKPFVAVPPSPDMPNVIEVSGFAKLEDAAAAAKLISGKEPLRDELEDEGP